MADSSFLSSDGSADKDFEFVSYPPPPSSDVIPLREVLYLNDVFNNTGNEFEQDLVAFRCPPLTRSQLSDMFDAEGRIVDEHAFRKAVFRGRYHFQICS